MSQGRLDLPALDNEIDPIGSSYRQIASEYDAYMMGEYTKNYDKQKLAWDRHYEQMRTAGTAFLVQYIQKHKPLQEIIMAVVGAGFDPGARDFDPRMVRTMLAEMRGVLLLDFSMFANRSAVHSLMNAGMPADRLRTFQYDVSGGLSTHYHDVIMEKIANIETEDQIVKVAEELGEMDIVSEIEGREFDLMAKIRKAPRTPLVIEGTLNTLLSRWRRALAPTSGGKRVPVDLVTYNMVLSGTGAASEGNFWELFNSMIESQHRVRDKKTIDDDTIEQRKSVIRNMHLMITRYNTHVAFSAIQDALKANPDARVLAVTDVSTHYHYHDQPLDVGELPRLDVKELTQELGRKGIDLVSGLIPSWLWEDEPEHGHGIVAMKAQRKKSKNGSLPPNPATLSMETEAQSTTDQKVSVI